MSILKLPAVLYQREALKKPPKKYIRSIANIINAHARLELYVTELVHELLRLDGPLGRQVLRADQTAGNFLIATRAAKLWKIWNVYANLQYKNLASQ